MAVTTEGLSGRTEKLSRLRKTIARRMVESLQVSAQLTSVVEVDVSAVAALRQRAKDDFLRREGVKLSFLPFMAKAALDALAEHPKLNASMDLDKGEVTYYEARHLAIAVDTERGLFVPVIHDAGDMTVGQLAKHIAELADRTRSGKITAAEMSGGTFTLTNTGSRGVLFDTPILNQPQVAILATGAIVDRAVVVKGEDGTKQIAIRPMVYLALSYDHRLVDGADAARYLSTVKNLLEQAAYQDQLSGSGRSGGTDAAGQ